MTQPGEAQEIADRMAARAIAAGDPTGWFEPLYAAAAAGRLAMPWDRGEPSPYLTQWTADRGVTGAGRSAVIVGCGLGDDAEFIAGLGFQTTAFDISPTAITMARSRFRDSPVRYQAADLLNPPLARRTPPPSPMNESYLCVRRRVDRASVKKSSRS